MKAEDIFLAVLERNTPTERANYLDQACGANAELRALVDSLLRSHHEVGSFLEQPVFHSVATANEPNDPEPPGTVIGPYKLLQLIGEGGMGAVYMAEQNEPVHRKVALKIVKPGMDSRQVIARFEAERQALALMDHPNIAKVLDAGATDTGRPYFVMELVKGVPITKYCDENRLTLKQRLELFIPVCQAVQHAHQKGIIHRDLKPSNVLIAPYDRNPVPKIIDFGVAKATGLKLTDRTLFTALGAVIGTLEYMSPEQAELNNLDIDTRSDVYSLGVLLYELMTGTTPLEPKKGKASVLLELLRHVREEEPPKPSTRLSTTAELPAIAANRGVEPQKLRGLVRGELDWIVMKCLEKDRNRRYETANGLALDIQNYLHDEPILAGPTSAGYRLRKFVRRNKGPVVAAGLVLAALVAGIIGTTAGLLQARAESDEKEKARQQAEVNFRKARQAVDEYFTRVSENALLQEPALESLRKQLLQDSLRYYEDFVREHGDDPELQAELAATYMRITTLTYDLGPEEDWVAPYQKAVTIVEDLLRKKPAASAFQAIEGGIYHINTGGVFHIRQPEEGLRTFERAQAVWEELVRKYPSVPGFQNDLALTHLVIAVIKQGWTSPDRGDPTAEVVASYQNAADLWRTLIRANPHVGHHRASLAQTLSNMSHQMVLQGQLTRGEEISREALETAQKLVADFPNVPAWQELLTGYVCWGHGGMLEHFGRHQEAEPVYRQMLAGQESQMRKYPTVDRYRKGVVRARMALGELLWATGRAAEAAEMHRPVRALAEQLSPEDTQAGYLLAWFLATSADPQFRDARRAIEVARKLVEKVPQEGTNWVTLGVALYRAGDYKAAVPVLEKARQLASDRPSAGRFHLAMAYGQLGEKDMALHWYDEAITFVEKYEMWGSENRRIRADAERVLGLPKAEKP